MNTHSYSQKWSLKHAYILAAVLLIGALFFVLPQGRALAQEVMHYFSRGESNVMPGVTVTPVKWIEQTPGAAAATFTPQPTAPGPAFEAECGSFNAPRCSIEEIRGLVDFPVFALAELPDGMIFTGATGGPDQVHLFYKTPNQTGVLAIWEEPFISPGDRQAWEVGADADIQKVQVGAVTAEYVKGSYDGSSNPPVWNADLNVQVLRWVDQGILINLQMLGAEPRLGRDDLAALAATLTDGQVADVTPVPNEKRATDKATETQKGTDFLKERFSLSIEQAEQQSGIKIHLPDRLPDVLTLQGARYEPEQTWVIVFYLFDQTQWGPNTDGLSITEQAAPVSGDCGLCGFIAGDASALDTMAPGKLVGKDTKIETFQIGDTTAQYVEGVWKGTDCCGWVWESDPYMKRLRWKANGMAYELSYMGMGITKEDMVAIAEGLK